MTEVKSRFSAEEVAEHYRQIAERGYAESNGQRYYELKTLYGKISCITNLADQKKLFRNAAIVHLIRSNKIEFDEACLHRLLIDPNSGDELYKELKEILHPEVLTRLDEITEKAINYFYNNLNKMFGANMTGFVEESFFYALIKTIGKDPSRAPETESAIFSGFVKFGVSRLKERLDIRKASGRKRSKTDEELRQMMLFYDSVLPLIRKAKKDYNPIKGRYGWVHSIKALHPYLYESIIEKLDQKGITPSELALMWVAEEFDTEPTESLRKKLISIRKTVAKNK